MKPFSRFVLTTILAFAPVAVAVAQTPSGVVNKLEVQKLVAEGTPEANASLAKHFQGLAAQYETDAAKHKAMEQGFIGNPNRGVASGAAAHCKQLAKDLTESAAAAKEMAKYHEQLAGGKTIAAPKGAAAFDSGAGAPEPTAKELKQLAAKANSATEHRRLEEYYLTIAKRYTADAASHEAMAGGYRAGVRKGTFDPAAHCDHLAKLARDAAKEASDAAALHRQLASVA